ncbi:ATP-dependent metallopeptidase FtsH/Yme1/Tma family protein [Clostridium cylindrosporum]|uniref:ATP-dependent zinc metalloprotease FtsH n=1 Tax=Clostridium cylindrosporum DSM 605 TaxID=1121307 RepID=A0A0J8DG04_CLOCY|nr:AAA family ATPase [Clostridium cylindrosporum]KMT23098.1 ATP-dependent zinc metalloprotease FtsH 1 [Clostridium cylindrosporum DSM 605]
MLKIKKKLFFITFLALTISLFIGVYSYNIPSVMKSSYKDFLVRLNSGKISDVYIESSSNIKYTLKNGKKYSTSNPNTNTFKEELLIKDINVHEGTYSSSNLSNMIISVLLILGVGLLAYRYIKSKSKLKSSSLFKEATAPNINFDDVAGNIETKESLRELVDFLKTPEKYKKFNARQPKGVILYGPPGTGKTLMAKALASEANVPFYSTSGSDFVQMYAGVGASRIRDLFKKARENEKAVIFIDEVDAIGKKRAASPDSSNDERDQTLNALLTEMSGFKSCDNIIVLAATNRLDSLDEALLRPGRFDRHIEVSLPDINARESILRLHCTDKPLSNDVDIRKLAEMTVYFSGAKLENLVNEAAILAAKNNKELIEQFDFEKAYEIVLAGFEKKDRSYIKENDRRITAYHEAGHALVSRLLLPNVKVKKVSIIPSTKGAGGYTLNIHPNSLYHTKISLINNIKVSLAGRAAEDIIFGSDNITTGAEGDIKHATNILLSMIKHYGMFESMGMLNYEMIEGASQKVLDLSNYNITLYYNEVLTLLQENKATLDKIADALLEKEYLEEDELSILVS